MNYNEDLSFAKEQSTLAMEQANLATRQALLATKQVNNMNSGGAVYTAPPVQEQNLAVRNFGPSYTKQKNELSWATKIGLPILIFLFAVFVAVSAWLFYGYNSQLNIFQITDSNKQANWLTNEIVLKNHWTDVAWALFAGAIILLGLVVWNLIRTRNLRAKYAGFFGLIFLTLTNFALIALTSTVIATTIAALVDAKTTDLVTAIHTMNFLNLINLVSWELIVSGCVGVLGAFLNIFYTWYRTRYIYLTK